MSHDVPRLTPVATFVLADAMSVASQRGDDATTVHHLLHSLAVSVSDGRESRARSVIESLGGELPDEARSVLENTQCLVRDLPDLTHEVFALLDTAIGMAHATAESAVATHHLLAALVELGYLTALAESGLTPDMVLSRAVDIETPDDLIRELGEPPIDMVAAASTPPTREDLSRRTTIRRSAMHARLITIGLPTGPRGSTSLGRIRTRYWLLAWAVQLLTLYLAIPAILHYITVTGRWWMALLFLPCGYIPAGMGIPMHILLRIPVAVLAPSVIVVLVLVNLFSVLAQLYLMLWFSRVVQGEPRSRSSSMWRSYWKETQRMGAEVRRDGFWS